MPWEDLHGEIVREMASYSTFGVERIEWMEQRRLSFRRSASYCEYRRAFKEWERHKSAERAVVRGSSDLFCAYCFQPLNHSLKSSCYKYKYCCRDHAIKAGSTCTSQWRLPDGDDNVCLYCQRSFKESVNAPDRDVCSSRCWDKLMCGEWVWAESIPAKGQWPLPEPWKVPGEPLPRGPDPITIEPEREEDYIMSYVIAKCVACGHRKKIKPGEVNSGDLPMCEKCYSPMVAEKAVKK